MIDPRGGLAVAELIFFIPAFFVAFIVCKKHGFGRISGWVFLLFLSLIKTAGAIAELVAELQPGNSGASTTAAILSSVGFSTLLIALVGILQRVHSGFATGLKVPPRMFNLLMVALLAGLIVAIVGGVKLATSKTTGQLDSARTFTHAAAIIFLVVFVLTAFIAALTIFRIKAVAKGEKVLAVVALLSVPFLLVHLVYLMLTNFNANPALFNTTSGDVIIRAFMTTFEDFIVVILLLTAGLKAPKVNHGNLDVTGESSARPGHHHNEYELLSRRRAG